MPSWAGVRFPLGAPDEAALCMRVKACRASVPGRMGSAFGKDVPQRCGESDESCLPSRRWSLRALSVTYASLPGRSQGAVSSTKSVARPGKRMRGKERALSSQKGRKARKGTAACERVTGGADRPSKTNPPAVTGKGRALCSTLRGEGRRSRSSGLWDGVATRSAHGSRRPAQYLARGKASRRVVFRPPKADRSNRERASQQVRKLAQLVEQRSLKPMVVGSIPTLESKRKDVPGVAWKWRNPRRSQDRTEVAEGSQGPMRSIGIRT